MTVPESNGGLSAKKLERERMYREAKERTAQRLRDLGDDKMADRLLDKPKTKPPLTTVVVSGGRGGSSGPNAWWLMP